MSDRETNVLWRNVLLASARGLEYTFGAIAKALSGEEPVEVSGFSRGQNLEPSQSNKTGGRGKREKKEKKEKRAPNAYALFVSEQMKVLKEEYPDVPNTERFKLVAQDWKTSTKNKKNVGAQSEAPASPTEVFAEAHKRPAAAAAAHVDEEEEEGEEVTGGRGEIATQEFFGTQEKREKKEKKKRKKERREEEEAYEGGGTGFHKGAEEEQATPEKRTSKKSKR